jgi:hypothetical protein
MNYMSTIDLEIAFLPVLFSKMPKNKFYIHCLEGTWPANVLEKSPSELQGIYRVSSDSQRIFVIIVDNNVV